ncbi:oxidoreductase, partial [Mycobacterium avium subsp. hominissuis]
FTPPFMPPAAAPAPMPPAPADYSQQLFGYLQAWRQYLEQMAGASSGSAQQPTAPTTMPPTMPPPTPPTAPPPSMPSTGGQAFGAAPPGQPGTSGDPTPGGSTPVSATAKGSTLTWPPPLLGLEPSSYVGTQDPPVSRFLPPNLVNRVEDRREVLLRPNDEYGYLHDLFSLNPGLARAISSTGPAPVASGSSFLGAMNRVGPDVSARVTPRSLFSSRAARAPSAGAITPGSRTG